MILFSWQKIRCMKLYCWSRPSYKSLSCKKTELYVQIIGWDVDSLLTVLSFGIEEQAVLRFNILFCRLFQFWRLSSSLDTADEPLDISKYHCIFMFWRMPIYHQWNCVIFFDKIVVKFSDCTFTSFSVSSAVGDKMSSEGQEFLRLPQPLWSIPPKPMVQQISCCLYSWSTIRWIIFRWNIFTTIGWNNLLYFHKSVGDKCFPFPRIIL